MAETSVWVKIGKIDAIPDGVTSYRKKWKNIAVFKEDGQVKQVFKDNCPHNKRILISTDYRINEGETGEKQITCRYHGACFRMNNGETIKGPGREGLHTYNFEVNEKGELVILLDK